MDNKENDSVDFSFDVEKDNKDDDMNWAKATINIVFILVIGLLIAMCGGWMPWQV